MKKHTYCSLFKSNQIAVKQVLAIAQANIDSGIFKQVNRKSLKLVRKKLTHGEISEHCP